MFLNISLEDDKAPVVENEKEIVIYVKIGDRAGLDQAFKKEEQFQGQIKTEVGSIRVRRTKNADESYKYEQTTKVEQENTDVKTMREVTLEITKEQYEQFLSVTPYYMDKVRYCFKAEQVSLTMDDKVVELSPDDLIYEVDVFKDKDGNESEWCKIDVEIQKLSAKLQTVFGENIPDVKMVVKVNQLPFKPNNFVLEDDSDNKDKKALIKSIYDTQFLIANPALVKSDADSSNTE